MFKSLALTVAMLLSVCLGVVSAQTGNNYADNPRTTGSTAPASPEAKAEARRLYKEGVKYGLAGLYPQAIEILQRSVKLDPQLADAHFALGHAYFDLKQWRNAVESLKAAVELNPKDQEARDRLGLARAMLWEEDSAKLAAQRRQNPRPPQPATEQVSLNVKAPSTPEAAAAPAPEVNAAAAIEEVTLTKIYRVGPNDVLDIRINDNAASQSTLFTVTTSGFVEHPMLGEPLQASGLTVDEIGSKFESELKRRALADNPKVSVGVRDYASHTILVSGLVKDSGTKILRREAIPLYVVVADAQPLPEAARVTVVRNESNATFEIDLTQTKEMNLLVRPGDVITLLPSETQFVYIGGEVKSPGEKIFRRGLTLTQAIIAAGGVTPKAKEARLGRDNGEGFLVVTRYKLKEIESGKVQDPVVKPGDRITIHD
ncbi:MAG TPA: tetratricopeptide repeat protein [Pyrinomonadaceae bacterium]|jgi:polysaccharide export outer membrane protein|nr:tetratricopeptide repeat protein [Pyrinomonadaceae bacterium]